MRTVQYKDKKENPKFCSNTISSYYSSVLISQWSNYNYSKML